MDSVEPSVLHAYTSLLGLDVIELGCYRLLWEVSESSLFPPYPS